MQRALAVVLALCAVPCGAQLPEPAGPARLLGTVLSPIPPWLGAAAERGESTLAIHFVSSSNVTRLGPQGLALTSFARGPAEVFAPGPGDGVWTCHVQTAAPSGRELRCQRLDRNFAALAPELSVHATPGNHLVFATGSDAAGNLAVAWREYPIMTQDPGTIAFRLLAASGTSMGPTVPAFGGDGALYGLGLARFPSGAFAVLTERNGPPGQVWAQLVSAAGTPAAPFQVSMPPSGADDTLAGVASAANGFAVMWTRSTTGPHVEVLVQRYGANGQALGAPVPFLDANSSAAGQLGLGCDGWGRCVTFGATSHRFYDAQGAAASSLLPGGAGGVFGLAVSPSGAFTVAFVGEPPPTLDGALPLPPVPVNWGLWSQRYQGSPKGDLDADRSTDVVLQHTGTRALELWALNGTTRVGAARPIPVVPAAGWQAVGADDFDGDRRQDLVLWDGASGAVEFWSMGGADGTTRLGVHPLTGIAPLAPPWRPAATGDFDGDGKPDLLWRNEATGLLRLWMLDGSAYRGTLTPNPAQGPDLGWRVAAAADLDNDGRRDLVWYHAASSGIIFWYMDTAMQRLDSRPSNPATGGGSNWQLAGAGEFGAGTGRAAIPAQDLLWRNEATGRLVVWHMSPQGTRISGGFTTPDAPVDPLSWSVAAPR